MVNGEQQEWYAVIVDTTHGTADLVWFYQVRQVRQELEILQEYCVRDRRQYLQLLDLTSRRTLHTYSMFKLRSVPNSTPHHQLHSVLEPMV
jgi:hypothetical protein